MTGARGLFHARGSVCANYVGMSEHVIEDISVKFDLLRNQQYINHTIDQRLVKLCLNTKVYQDQQITSYF